MLLFASVSQWPEGAIQAVAIDPQTARTALAGQINNHYLLKYGTLFASSFLQGVGSSLQAVNSTSDEMPSSNDQ